MHDVIIIGAGFSGLSAAVDLSSRGAHVLVLEGRPQLGGRATSYRDKVTGEWVDNGQHVLFGCYRDTFRFLRRLGVDSDVYLPTTLSVDCIGRDNRLYHRHCTYSVAFLSGRACRLTNAGRRLGCLGRCCERAVRNAAIGE